MDVHLEPLSAARARDVRQFEEVNRAFFASHVSDRGDGYFEHFDERFERLVAEHASGTSLLFLVVSADGGIVGRVNILDVDQPGRTEIGFRVAQEAQGHGVATRAVEMALEEAARCGVRAVSARASTDNIGSQRVLERCGFTRTGQAPAPEGSGRTFVGYLRMLD